jgi:hypothetical protein
MKRRLCSSSGQSIIEFALILPLLFLLVFGIVDIGYVLLDQHIVTKLTREGSNLISRNTTLADATTAMQNMSTRPVDFSNGSKVIFSVVKQVDTSGAPNFGKPVLYQRYSYGTLGSSSYLRTVGAGSFGSSPEYLANNSDTDTSLQITNLPAGVITTGGMLYVTEIYSTHTPLTPLARFGVALPNTLYSIAYF